MDYVIRTGGEIYVLVDGCVNAGGRHWDDDLISCPEIDVQAGDHLDLSLYELLLVWKNDKWEVGARERINLLHKGKGSEGRVIKLDDVVHESKFDFIVNKQVHSPDEENQFERFRYIDGEIFYGRKPVERENVGEVFGNASALELSYIGSPYVGFPIDRSDKSVFDEYFVKELQQRLADVLARPEYIGRLGMLELRIMSALIGESLIFDDLIDCLTEDKYTCSCEFEDYDYDDVVESLQKLIGDNALEVWFSEAEIRPGKELMNAEYAIHRLLVKPEHYSERQKPVNRESQLQLFET